MASRMTVRTDGGVQEVELNVPSSQTTKSRTKLKIPLVLLQITSSLRTQLFFLVLMESSVQQEQLLTALLEASATR